jgi:hypothetical protein
MNGKMYCRGVYFDLTQKYIPKNVKKFTSNRIQTADNENRRRLYIDILLRRILVANGALNMFRSGFVTLECLMCKVEETENVRLILHKII